MDLVSNFYRDHEPLRRLVRDLAHAPQARTLDAGCKSGDITLSLAEHVGELTALDIHDHQAWRARSGRISFVVADAMALPFGDACFDQIVAAECLQYVARPEAALDEFARVIRPGGVLVLSFPERGPLATYLDPYNVIRLAKRWLMPRRPTGPFVTHLRSRRILEHSARHWRCRDRYRRGTVMFIYLAWTIDQVQSVRLRLRRGGPGARWLAEALLGRAIRILFGLMQLDFALPWAGLSYNNVIRLERRGSDGSPA